MYSIFATDLGLSPLSIGAIVISGVSFIVMFGIASAKGGYEELIKTTLDNDAANRERGKTQSK
tara:strand:+ start:725 stop:913 length:189 start_codon:yes stop_codon:yes gene_type:complete